MSLVLGLGLLALNVSGLFLSLRNPALREEEGPGFHPTLVLTEDQFKNQVARKPHESDEDYLYRLTETVHSGILHYWEDEGRDRFNLRVPPWENYLLYLASFLDLESFRRYEFSSAAKAMERGVGLCSQQSIVELTMLQENGVEANLVSLSGHVVLRARVDGKKWYVADPDYGVVVPHDISEIEEDPEIIKPYYLEALRPRIGKTSEWRTNLAVRVFGKEGNRIVEDGVAGFVGWKKYYFEKVSYVAIWVIPVLLCIPAAMAALKQNSSRSVAPIPPSASVR